MKPKFSISTNQHNWKSSRYFLITLSINQETQTHINIASYFIFGWGDCFYNTWEFQSKFFVEIVNLKQPFIDIADLKNQNIVQEIGSSLLQVFCQKATSVPESLFDKLYPADLLKRRLY